MQLKKIGLESLETLRILSFSTFTDAFYDQNESSDFDAYASVAFSEEKLKEELSNPESEFFFVYDHDKLAGYIKLNKHIDYIEKFNPTSVELQRIYISKEFQSKGVGAKATREIISYVTSSGFKSIWLGVWEHNPKAISFYEKLGFRKVGSHSFMLGTSNQLDQLYSLDLE